jgi:hypothetical protein
MKMKRKKLYILIAVLTAVIIFNIAAICNQCSVAQTSNTDKETGENKIEADTNITNPEATTSATETAKTPTTIEQIIYANTQYGFSFTLPDNWEGYSIIIGEWEGNPPDSGTVNEKGPIISIRNPKWSQGNPYQDIPIMVFTISQWDLLQNEEYHIGAAPIGPTELGRNINYVFALPARYNYSYLAGWEEVEKILEGDPLKTF